jgi:hypothetical protein
MVILMKMKQIGHIFIIIAIIFVILELKEFQYEIMNAKSTKGKMSLNPHSSSTHALELYKIWGDFGNDVGIGIVVDDSGNIYITGCRNECDSEYNIVPLPPNGWLYDIFLLKFDPNGKILWNRTWGNSGHDAGLGIASDNLNNIYITGYTSCYEDGFHDVCLLKYDSSGNLLWNETWGGSENDGGIGVAVDNSDNLYVSGYTDRNGFSCDIFLQKYYSNGTLLWNETWGGIKSDVGGRIALGDENTIYIAGTTESYGMGDRDICLLKYNSNGSLVWNETWGGSEYDAGIDIATDDSTNVYITGITKYSGSDHRDLHLLKFDLDGNLLWNVTWDGYRADHISGIVTDGSGNIYLTGHKNDNTTYYDICMLKYDSKGTLVWSKTWEGSKHEEGIGIAMDNLSSIYITGYTTSYGAGLRDVCLLIYKFEFKEDKTIPGYNLQILFCVIGLAISYLYIINNNKCMCEILF